MQVEVEAGMVLSGDGGIANRRAQARSPFVELPVISFLGETVETGGFVVTLKHRLQDSIYRRAKSAKKGWTAAVHPVFQVRLKMGMFTFTLAGAHNSRSPSLR